MTELFRILQASKIFGLEFDKQSVVSIEPGLGWLGGKRQCCRPYAVLLVNRAEHVRF